MPSWDEAYYLQNDYLVAKNEVFTSVWFLKEAVVINENESLELTYLIWIVSPLMSGFFSSKPVIGFCVFSSIKYMKSCPFISNFGLYSERKR